MEDKPFEMQAVFSHKPPLWFVYRTVPIDRVQPGPQGVPRVAQFPQGSEESPGQARCSEATPQAHSHASINASAAKRRFPVCLRSHQSEMLQSLRVTNLLDVNEACSVSSAEADQCQQIN